MLSSFAAARRIVGPASGSKKVHSTPANTGDFSWALLWHGRLWAGISEAVEYSVDPCHQATKGDLAE